MKTRAEYIKLAEDALALSLSANVAGVDSYYLATAQVYATLATSAPERNTLQYVDDYNDLRRAILQHLDKFVEEDDVAEIAILCDAVEKAGQCTSRKIKELIQAASDALRYFETDAEGIHPESIVENLREAISEAM